jgi:EAL domain-containing protein (putative c-di-GMP-specific phosphodiesterase class I)
MTQTENETAERGTAMNLYTEFQPIYSLNTKKVIGIEALARCDGGDRVIMPSELFDDSQTADDLSRMDTECFEKALKAFKFQERAETLFINIDTALLSADKTSGMEIVRKTAACDIPAEHIVLELATKRIKDNYSVMVFVDCCRKNGFLIAMDNADGSEKTLEAIEMINPDIIKIDRSVVSGIDTDTDKKAQFNAVIAAARRIGALTIAVGTETVDEVIECILLDADYFQGFYFSKPEKINRIFSNEVRLKLEDAAHRLNVNIKNNPTAETVRIESYKRIIYNLVTVLTGLPNEQYEPTLYDYLSEHPELECAFMMDHNGFQITSTVMSKESESLPGYTPGLLGENHGIKNYFYAVRERIEDPFISGWYTSAATGKQCKTISSKFFDSKGKMVVVSVDLKKD